jgi:triosephosphate isomerase (TIM)
MARKKIVAGNWKMNNSLLDAVELVRGIQSGMKDVPDVEIILFPPFPFLKTVTDLLIQEEDFFTGAQNCSEHDKGAYTGEVSATMVRSVGCSYVIIGHSERRQHFYEDGSLLARKVKQALSAGLRIIYCFGEQLNERNSSNQDEVVRSQLTDVLKDFPIEKASQLVLAYEPVWAIGTGVNATARQAQEMHAFVRKTVAGLLNSDAAAQMPILYGGSCNPRNAGELFACADVDGGLIGGASLKAADFCAIAKSFT